MGHRGEDCVHFLKGACTWGDSCNFRHVEAAKAATTPCPAWLARHCFADDCPLLHPKPAEKFNQGQRGSFGSGHPIHGPEGQPLCKYQFQGGCNRMATCSFYHLPPGATMGNDRLPHPHEPRGMPPMGGPMQPHHNPNGYNQMGPRPGFMPGQDFYPYDGPFTYNNNFNGPRGDGFGPRAAGPFGAYDGFGPQGGYGPAPMRPTGRTIYVHPDYSGPVPNQAMPPVQQAQQQPLSQPQQAQEQPAASPPAQQAARSPSPKPAPPTTASAPSRSASRSPSKSPTSSVISTGEEVVDEEEEEEEAKDTQPRFVLVLDGDEEQTPTPKTKPHRSTQGNRRGSAGLAARDVKEALSRSHANAQPHPPSKKKTPSPPAPQAPARLAGRLGTAAAAATTTAAPKHNNKQATLSVAAKPPAPKTAPAKTAPTKPALVPAKTAPASKEATSKRTSSPRDSLEGVKVKTLAELLAEKRAQQQAATKELPVPAPTPTKVHTVSNNTTAATKRQAECVDEVAVKRARTEEVTATVFATETPIESDDLDYGDDDAFDLTEEDMAMFEGEGEEVNAGEEVPVWQSHLDYLLSL